MEHEVGLENDESSDSAKPSLLRALLFTLASYTTVFCTTLYEDYGVIFSAVLFDHPAVFMEYLAQAFGGSFVFPLAHVGLASIFKSKRNPSSRRRIFIGWSIIIIIVALLTLASGTPRL